VVEAAEAAGEVSTRGCVLLEHVLGCPDGTRLAVPLALAAATAGSCPTWLNICSCGNGLRFKMRNESSIPV
jgi:hypothetical protein